MPANRLRAAKRRHARPRVPDVVECSRRIACLAEFDAEFGYLLLGGGDAAEQMLPLFRRVGDADFGVLAFCDLGLAAHPPRCPAEAADRAEVRAAAIQVAEEFARLPRTVALSRRSY